MADDNEDQIEGNVHIWADGSRHEYCQECGDCIICDPEHYCSKCHQCGWRCECEDSNGEDDQ